MYSLYWTSIYLQYYVNFGNVYVLVGFCDMHFPCLHKWSDLSHFSSSRIVYNTCYTACALPVDLWKSALYLRQTKFLVNGIQIKVIF